MAYSTVHSVMAQILLKRARDSRQVQDGNGGAHLDVAARAMVRHYLLSINSTLQFTY